jgi:hypothetical protein
VKVRFVKAALLLGAVCASVAFLVSCNKDTNFGQDVVPVLNLQLSQNQVPITYRVDNTFPQRTDYYAIDQTDQVFNQTHLGESLVGVLNDPQYGRLRAASFLQFLPVVPDTIFTDFDLRVDSVFLYLNLAGKYGDVRIPQRLRVFEIADTLSTNVVYTNNDSVRVDRSRELTPVGGVLVSFTDTTANRQIRIQITDTVFNNRFITGGGRALFSNGLRFKQLYRGLYVESAPVTPNTLGAIYQLDCFGPGTKLEFKYSSRDSLNQQLKPRYSNVFNQKPQALQAYVISNTAFPQKFSMVRRTGMPGTLLGNALAGGGPTAGQYLPIQGASTIGLKMRIGDITQALGAAAINSATLTLKADPAFFGPDSLLTPPTYLRLFAAASDSVTPDVTNSVTQQIIYGQYNANTRSYTFNIRSYIQLIRSRSQFNYGTLIVPAYRSRRISRVVLGGPNHPNPALRPELKVLYTIAP